MITITETAAEKIKELMPEEDDIDYGLKMSVRGGGCAGMSYQMQLASEPGPKDKLVESNGIKMFIDMKSALYLAGASIDWMDGLLESGFKITNPNARTKCGCGQSFS